MQRPLIKDKAILAYVEHLEQELDKFITSPYCSSYITLKSQIDSFNEQLTIGIPEIKKIEIEGKEHELIVTPGKIDLFADKNAKEFDRAYKILLDFPALIKNLVEMQKSLTPEERKDIESKLEAAAPLAERIALKGR